MSGGRLLLLFAAATATASATLPPIIRIGAVFTEDQKDSSSELAFKYAVYRINKDKTLLPNTTIVYDIQYVPRDDSFRTSKKVCRQLESGVQALFGPSDGALGTHIQSICEALDVPHIEARSDAEPVPKEFSINLYPAPKHTAQAFQDLLSFLGWSRMAVLYEDETGLFRRHEFINSASKPDVYILQTSPANYREVLKDIKRKQIFNLVVDTNPAHMTKFFRAILQLQMNDDRYHYLFTTYDIEVFDLEDFKYNGVNMTAFRLVDVTSPSVMKALEQMERFQPIGKAILNKNRVIQAEPALMYDSVHVFAAGLTAMDSVQALRPTNLSCDLEKPFDGGLSLYNYINSASIDGLTGKIEFNEGKRNNFKLDLMNLRKEELHKVGEWTPESGVHIFPETEDLTANITLVVVTKLEKPYVMLKEGNNITGNAMYEGFCIDLLKLIARKVGFRYTIRLVPDNTYGSYDPNTHQWNGIVGELVHKQADIAVAPITIDKNRETVIDFTKPFMSFGIGVLFKATKNQSKHIFSFMNPFDVKIWLYMLAAYVTVSLTFYAIARFSPHTIKADVCQQVPDLVDNQFTVYNSFWFITGTLLKRGSGLNPKATSKRIIGAVWWFFTLIIMSSYTANLAAFRTIDYMISPIKSAADLADQDEIAFGTLRGGSTMNFFKDSNIEIYQKMWQNMIKTKSVSLVPTYEDGIQRTLKGNYAFLMESTMLDYTVRRNCLLKQIGGLLDSKNYGIATTRGFAFKNKISHAILELRQNGQIQKIYDNWWTDSSKNFCEQLYEPKANALDGRNLGGLFLVLVCGLSLAVLVAIIEFYCNTHKKRHKTVSFNTETPVSVKKRCADCSPVSMYTPTRINKEIAFQDSSVIQMVDMRKFSLSSNKKT